MEDSQPLSGFPQQHDAPGPVVAREAVFDACGSGVALRAVLLVELVVAAAAMFGAAGPVQWFEQLAFFTGAALPATLLWLVSACLLKPLLGRQRTPIQFLAGVSLGALAGVGGCAMLFIAGLLPFPPWWASAFAAGLMAACGVSALALRARAATPASTQAKLAELQARIRPHFLFNTLNSAIALVRKEPARAEALLEDLSDLFRNALQERGGAATLAQEIELARRYMAIEQVRFGARLRVEWDIDPAANGARLPPLLLQPLLENAVRHGVEPSESGAAVKVSTRRRGSSVVVKVSNSLPAGQGEPGSGLALDNVRSRLALMHDLEGQFRAGLREGLFQVRIEVPA